jgi:hypothetical protein
MQNEKKQNETSTNRHENSRDLFQTGSNFIRSIDIQRYLAVLGFDIDAADPNASRCGDKDAAALGGSCMIDPGAASRIDAFRVKYCPLYPDASRNSAVVYCVCDAVISRIDPSRG